jgi:hypothetical protein
MQTVIDLAFYTVMALAVLSIFVIIGRAFERLGPHRHRKPEPRVSFAERMTCPMARAIHGRSSRSSRSPGKSFS